MNHAVPVLYQVFLLHNSSSLQIAFTINHFKLFESEGFDYTLLFTPLQSSLSYLPEESTAIKPRIVVFLLLFIIRGRINALIPLNTVRHQPNKPLHRLLGAFDIHHNTLA